MEKTVTLPRWSTRYSHAVCPGHACRRYSTSKERVLCLVVTVVRVMNAHPASSHTQSANYYRKADRAQKEGCEGYKEVEKMALALAVNTRLEDKMWQRVLMCAFRSAAAYFSDKAQRMAE